MRNGLCGTRNKESRVAESNQSESKDRHVDLRIKKEKKKKTHLYHSKVNNMCYRNLVK